MNKFKKMMSVTLASCMAASALMMSAGAANTPRRHRYCYAGTERYQ